MDGLRKELCALKFRKMHTKSENNFKKKIFCRFLFIRMERNAHINISILVYCSVKCLFVSN